jgi:hypothetical protein
LASWQQQKQICNKKERRSATQKKIATQKQEDLHLSELPSESWF